MGRNPKDRTRSETEPWSGSAEGAVSAPGAKGRSGMRTRCLLVLSTMALAIVLAACGRASDLQIDQALGITPTPTRTPEEIARATSEALAAATAASADAQAPEVAALGDVTAGRRQFNTQCVGCHGPGGRGPDILEPGSPGTDVTPDSLLALVREGTGHPEGLTYRTTELSDNQVNDLAAYILSEAAQ